MSGLLQLAPGATFAGEFRVLRPLSEGGMGAVYVVEQLSTGKQRALKVMQPALVTDERLRQRFVQEARVGALIDSEHIVDVVGAGVDPQTGTPWLAMELLRGETLSERVRRGPLPAGEVAEIYEQLGHALGGAHANGIVHRDLKPENIYLATSRRSGVAFTVKILDFGIAKIVAEAKTRQTAPMGTALWMAPEQTDANRGVQPSTDVWALGLIAFHLLTGHYYWRSAYAESPTPVAMIRELVFDPMPDVRTRARELGVEHLLPAGFDAWFARAVDRDPDRRFPNGSASVAELAAVLRGAPATRPLPVAAAAPAVTPKTAPMIAPPPIVESPAETMRVVPSRSMAVPIAIGLVVLAGVGAYLLTRSTSHEEQQTSVAPSVSVSAPPHSDPRPIEKKPIEPATPTLTPTPSPTPSPTPTPTPKATAKPAPSPSPASGGCSSFAGDYASAMRAREYACVRSMLMPKLNAGTISSPEARYLKSACGALGDVMCEKRAAERI